MRSAGNAYWSGFIYSSRKSAHPTVWMITSGWYEYAISQGSIGGQITSSAPCSMVVVVPVVDEVDEVDEVDGEAHLDTSVCVSIASTSSALAVPINPAHKIKKSLTVSLSKAP